MEEEKFIKFIVRNTKTGEEIHVKAPTPEAALLICSSDTPVGKGWRTSDCEVERSLI